MQIGEYTVIRPFVTAGSGYARWCVGEKNGKQYFLKQFLAPVQPVQTTETPTDMVLMKRRRCVEFEQKKRLLYGVLRRIEDESITHVSDFFVHDGHYFAVSDYIGSSFPIFSGIFSMPSKTKSTMLCSLAKALQTLHAHGVVHADLKPEHIILDNRIGKMQVRLIDFDSGFLEAAPPDAQSNIEVDPAYMAPETYLFIRGNVGRLSHKIDTFALGILLHQALAGEFPRFDREQYTYLYACILDRGKFSLSDQLTRKQKALIQKMLQKYPARRPGDREIYETLKASPS